MKDADTFLHFLTASPNPALRSRCSEGVSPIDDRNAFEKAADDGKPQAWATMIIEASDFVIISRAR